MMKWHLKLTKSYLTFTSKYPDASLPSNIPFHQIHLKKST